MPNYNVHLKIYNCINLCHLINLTEKSNPYSIFIVSLNGVSRYSGNIFKCLIITLKFTSVKLYEYSFHMMVNLT